MKKLSGTKMKRKKKLIDISMGAEKKLTKKAQAMKPPQKLKPFIESIIEKEADK